MTFRTEGQIIQAANMAQDLTNLVVAYLDLYLKHAQGLNGIYIPTECYTVVFRRIKDGSHLRVKLIYTRSTMSEDPTYYDAESYSIGECLGAVNSSGSSQDTEYHIEEADLTIPISVLLMTREQMERQVKEFAKQERIKIAEQDRLAKIAEHEEAIRKLQVNDKPTTAAINQSADRSGA